jgi:hypothetical protein
MALRPLATFEGRREDSISLTLANSLESSPRALPRQNHDVQRLNQGPVVDMFAVQSPQGLATKCVGATEQYPQGIGGLG